MANWYVNFGDGATTGYYAVAQWAALTAYNVGDLRRQLAAPSNANLRVFRCTTAGTSGAAEPTWTLTKAGVTGADGTAAWTEVTGNETYQGPVGNVWTAPHAFLANAIAWGTNGDTFYVASNHAETQAAALTLTLGTDASPMNVLCVTQTTVPPTSANLATGASIVTTGNNALSINKSSYQQGISYSAGSGAVNAALQFCSDFLQCNHTFVNCALKKAGTTGSTSAITWFNGEGFCTFINTTVQFGATGDGISLSGGRLSWKSTANAIQGASIPTVLFTSASTGPGVLFIEGVDLSAVAANTLFSGTGGLLTLKDCKVASNTVLYAGTPPKGYGRYQFINVDSGATNYRNEFDTYEGSQTTTTAVVRTGGASNGTAYSHKIVTTANCSWGFPLQFPPYSIWNATTGSTVAITIEGIADPRDFSALPKHDDISCDIECLETSGNPLGVITSGTKADLLATGSALTASTQAWDSGATARANTTAYVAGNIIKLATNPGRLFLCTTPGTTAGSEPAGYASAVDGGSVTDNTATFKAMWRFKQTITSGTIQLAGPITIYPKVAKASLNGIYLDPVPTISGVTVQRTYDVSPGAYVSELQAASGGGLLTHSGMLGGMRG